MESFMKGALLNHIKDKKQRNYEHTLIHVLKQLLMEMLLTPFT